MKRTGVTLAAVCMTSLATSALAQGPAGRCEDIASAFRDTRDEAERNLLFGPGANRTDARRAIDAYGKCAARREPDEARRILAMDFNSRAYKQGLDALGRDIEEECAVEAMKGPGSMRTSGLLFAGAVAEAILEADAAPINARLARAGGAKAQTFGPTDAVAQCLARSLPDQVGALFATEPGSAQENSAAVPLVAAVPACARASGISSAFEVTPAAWRSMIATAAYRLLAAQPS